jgi:asparagine synthase (glutamine-hydrolysing)
MCGIIGVVFDRPGRLGRELAISLVDALAHRGPDDIGWLSTSADGGLEHGRLIERDLLGDVVVLSTRLAIFDPSDEGHQPAVTPDGRYGLAFNGAVYNYRELRTKLEGRGRKFVSRSDTEVLLQALVEWGPAALDMVNGMFALAFVDAVEGRLLLARDFAGIKPLYHACWRDGFAFCSEIAPLLMLPGVRAAADPQRLYDYLRFGLTDHSDGTVFAGVERFPAAHCAIAEFTRPAPMRPTRYWSLDPSGSASLSHEQASTELRRLLLSSVDLHLRSDVTVGAALSGGIDSSSILAAATRSAERPAQLEAFCFAADDPRIDERGWAARVAQAVGVQLNEVEIGPKDLEQDVAALVISQEEPVSGLSIYAQHRVFRAARERGVKVMLSGQGADELLAGYPAYLASRAASLIRGGRIGAALALVHGARTNAPVARVVSRTAGLLTPRDLQGPLRHVVGRTPFTRWLSREWFAARGVVVPSPWTPRGSHVLHEDLRRSFLENSLPMLLRYEDRNAMAHSIENRVPFVTPEIVSFANTLPEDYLISPDGTTKSLLRDAMRGMVPEAVLGRRDKIGFAAPERQWLAYARPWIERMLDEEAVLKIPALEPSGVRALLGRAGSDPHVLWRLLNVVLWQRIFNISFNDA